MQICLTLFASWKQGVCTSRCISTPFAPFSRGQGCPTTSGLQPSGHGSQLCATHISRRLRPLGFLVPWVTESRLVCSADRSILDAVIDEGTASVSVTRLLPLDSDEVSKPVMPWDIPPTGKRDALNDATVACLERIKDACPELQRFTISTVTASGRTLPAARFRARPQGHGAPQISGAFRCRQSCWIPGCPSTCHVVRNMDRSVHDPDQCGRRLGKGSHRITSQVQAPRQPGSSCCLARQARPGARSARRLASTSGPCRLRSELSAGS